MGYGETQERMKAFDMDLESYRNERGSHRKLMAISSLPGDESGLRAYATELGKRIQSDVILLRQRPRSGQEARAALNHPEALYFELEIWRSPGLDSVGFEFQGEGQSIPYAEDHGDLVSAVSGLCEKIKRVELILTDSQLLKEALSETTMIPIFGIVEQKPKKGGYPMQTTSKSGKRGVAKTVALGALTAAMYAAVFWKSDAVMQLFTKGGVYAAFPIVTVFLFSFAHGAFASNLWSLLGIQPKTAEVHKTVSPAAKAVKTKAQRPRVHAYVNPFHNIHIKAK